AAEDHESRLDVAGLDRIVELIAVLFEFSDVAGEEITACAIDGVEIAVEDQARQMIVERRPAVMLVSNDVSDPARNVIFLLRGGEDRSCGGSRGRRGHGSA